MYDYGRRSHLSLVETPGIEKAPFELLEDTFKFLNSEHLSKIIFVSKKCLSAIEHSTQMPLKPLEDFELIHIDGLEIFYKNLHAKNPESVKISVMKLKLYLISNLSIGYNGSFFETAEKLAKIYGGAIPVKNLKLTPGNFLVQDFLASILTKKPKFFLNDFNVAQKLELELFYKDFVFLVENFRQIQLPKISTKIHLCHKNGIIPAGFEVDKILDFIFEAGRKTTIEFQADDDRLFGFYLSFLEEFLKRFTNLSNQENVCKLVFHAHFAETRWRDALRAYHIPVIYKEQSQERIGRWLLHAKEFDEWKLQIFGFDYMIEYIDTWKIVVHNRDKFIGVEKFDVV